MISSEQKMNILAAYPYMKRGLIDALSERYDKVRFVLDSGAFTAWKLGRPIKLDDYCRFIDGLPFKPWRYFTLDVIGDPEATMQNYQTMLQRGYNPLPIFTRGEDISVIDEFYKTSDVVGIGGLVGTPKNKGFVNGIMKRVADRRVHWLGFTSIDYVKHYRPYMCDSSSWSSGVRYGNVALYAGNGRFKKLGKRDFVEKPSRDTLRLLQAHGLSASDLAQRDHWINGEGNALRVSGFRSWLMFQRDVTKNLGTHFFLAIASETDLRSFFRSCDWLEEMK